ncbi:FAD-dependent oxidoreductase [uncultured Clostridium sp.]|uniref:NAD(P)/FAD-dependent oxidoreductase n=1 Tax=uncultured Clostridium sp. TaxID=59620 RepID=UPI002633FE62|nr:FAD-dependent oxidoreductase [uncultured Clostridium sp.]
MVGYDLIIVGGGASGMLAAIEAKRSGIENVIVIEKDLELGGFLNLANYNISENEKITGKEYKERLLKEYNELKIETLLNTMVLNINDEKSVICTSPERGIEELRAKNIILANGAKDKGRNIINMPGDRCAGVITLGMAKKFLNAGDISLGNEIIIYGTENLNTIIQDFKDKNVKIKTIIGDEKDSYSLTKNIYEGFKLKEILGKGRVQSIVIEKDDKEKTLECDTLILALGMLSDGIVGMRSNIKLNPATTGPEVDGNLETSRKTIFACGNGIYIHENIESIEKEVKTLIKYIK